MTDSTPDDIIRIDRTTRQLPTEEVEIVNDVLRLQMPGYTVVENAPAGDSEDGLTSQDFSPPIADLKAHFRRLARTDAARAEPSPSAQSLVDKGADLRMYRVRHEAWSDDVAPVTVIVSMREGDRKVIATA